MIRKNLVPLEMGARVLVGLPLLASPVLNFPTYPYNLLGIVLLATGVSGYCPLKALVQKLFSRQGSDTTSHSATASG